MSGAARGPVSRPASRQAAGLHVVAPRESPAERWADAVADRLAPALATPGSGRGETAAWSYGAVPMHSPPGRDPPDERSRSGDVAVALGGTGRPLRADTARLLAQALGAEVSDVRVHDDATAADTAVRAGTSALAVGADVVSLPGRLDDRTAAGRHTLVHEVAHAAHAMRHGGPAVVRRKGQGAAAHVPSTSLPGLPEDERKRIQVVTTTAVVVPGLKATFDPGTRQTAAAAVALDGSVPAALGPGLTNVAAELSNGSIDPPPLSPNSTLTLDLDLTPYGGTKGLVRFTYTSPPATGTGARAARILVESLGPAAAPAGTAPPGPATPGAEAPRDAVAEKMTKAGIVSLLTAADEPALREAVAQVPDTHLGAVRGLKVRRRPDHEAPDADAAGRYEPTTHTVTMFDRAFGSSQDVTATTGAAGGAVRTSHAARAIIHEIGHAVDLAPLRSAYATEAAADRAVADLPRRFPDPTDPTRWQWENKQQKAEIEKVMAAQKTARAATLASTSRSGTTVVETSKGGPTKEAVGTKPGTNAFRRAAAKDSPKAVSAYGDKDWQESYAEAYALFVSAPETLKVLRPATYDYFTANLP